MARYLTDQIVGKPKERVEVTGSHGDVAPTVVKIVHQHYPAAPATSAPGSNGQAKDVTAAHQLPRGSERASAAIPPVLIGGATYSRAERVQYGAAVPSRSMT